MARPLSILARHEEIGDSMAYLLGHFQKCHHVARTSRTLHFELISVVEVIAFQSFRDKEIH